MTACLGLKPFMAKRLLIVAHAPSENTLSLREATERGARSETGIDVRVVAPLQAGPDDVLAAQAVILGTTENLGYMSGALKDFFDRSYNPCLEKTQGLPYALYIRAGSDGTGTRRGVAWRQSSPACAGVRCRNR
jgi:NAD(P)H-dependent FMN reductase